MSDSIKFIKLFLFMMLSAIFMVCPMNKKQLQTSDQKAYGVVARKKAEEKFNYYRGKRRVCFGHATSCDCEIDCSDEEDEEYGLGLSDKEARKKVEENYEKLVQEYAKYEKEYPKIKKKRKETFCVSGGLEYSMTLDEIKQHVKKRFLDFKEKGLIISMAEFKKIKNRYFINTHFVGGGINKIFHKGLTRLWGVEHVKHLIKDNEELRNNINVPGYVIVIGNSKKYIDVKVDLFPCYHSILHICPVVSELKNAYIFFEYIKGEDVTKKIKKGDGKWERYRYNLLKKTGFTDFGRDDLAGLGNIIEKDGKLYIVDTELRSFGGIRQGNPSLAMYFWDKFRYCNNLPANSPSGLLYWGIDEISVRIEL